MRHTRLNVKMAKRRGLAKAEIRLLKALHFSMDCMVRDQNALYMVDMLNKKDIKQLSKSVRDIEFLMQDIWGFNPDPLRHTHWRRFQALLDGEPNELAVRVGTTAAVED